MLEVGCGPGVMSLALADAVGTTGVVNGIDNSFVMVAEATRRSTNQAQGRGVITKLEVDRWFADLGELARADRFFASLTMFGVCARKPQ